MKGEPFRINHVRNQMVTMDVNGIRNVLSISVTAQDIAAKEGVSAAEKERQEDLQYSRTIQCLHCGTHRQSCNRQKRN